MNENLENILNDISCVAQLLCERGWAEGNAGNISFNITEFITTKRANEDKSQVFKFSKEYPFLKNEYILVTGAGTRMRELNKDVINNTALINICENSRNYSVLRYSDLFHNLKEKKLRKIIPTSELPVHLSIHNFLKHNKRQERFILHTHPTELIALTQIKEYQNEKAIHNLLKNMLPEIKIVLPDGAGFVPCAMPGSERIAELTTEKIKRHRVVIWEKHGCIAINENIMTAFDIIETISKSAKIFSLCSKAGYKSKD